MEFDGVDLILRSSGDVLPKDGETGLLDSRMTADRHGISIPMTSTAITDVDSPYIKAVVDTCTLSVIRISNWVIGGTNGWERFKPSSTWRRRSWKESFA